jgi:hypothetical protein
MPVYDTRKDDPERPLQRAVAQHATAQAEDGGGAALSHLSSRPGKPSCLVAMVALGSYVAARTAAATFRSADHRIGTGGSVRKATYWSISFPLA